VAKRKNKLADKKKPDIHPELDGFTIEINKLGEITYSHDINAINEFLDKKVQDKKVKKTIQATKKPKKKK
jgi:hypothetical protein